MSKAADTYEKCHACAGDGFRACPHCLDNFAKPLVDMMEKHQWSADMALDRCPECRVIAAGDPAHEPDCALAKLLEHHGRTVKWKT